MKTKETKFDNFGALKPSDLFFSKLAILIFGNKRYQKEFMPFIILSYLGYSLAVFLSVFSSFFIVSDFFISVFTNPFLNGVVSVISLLLIETLLFFSLKGFFKFLLKGIVQNTIFLGLAALFGFVLIFVLTTNGIALMMSERVSKTSEIVEFHDIEKNTTKLDFEEQRNFLIQLIKNIENNPQGWSNGQRSFLTKEQLKEIGNYNNQLRELKQSELDYLNKIEKKEKTELKQNRNETTSEANKYFWVFAIIVGVEFLSVFYIVFSAFQIHKESNTDKHISDKVQDISNAVGNNIFAAIEEQMYHVQNLFAAGLQRQNLNFTPFEVVDKKQEDEIDKIDFSETKKPVVVGGFFNQQKNDFKADLRHEKNKTTDSIKTDLKTAETPRRLNPTNENLMFLKKHKKLVQTLKKYTPKELNNDLIKTIQKETKNDYKSRTTVLKVFVACQSIGFDRIDEKGQVSL